MRFDSQWLATLNLVLSGLVFLLGLVILRENPRHRLNRVVALLLFCGSFGAVLSALTLLLPNGADGTGLQTPVAYVWQLFFPSALLLASLFPEERSFTRPLRLPWGLSAPSFTVLVFTPHVFHILLVLVTGWFPLEPSSVGSGSGGVVGSLGRLVIGLFLAVHAALFSLVDLVFGVAAIALLADSRRRSRVPRVRQQLSAVLAGLASGLVLYALATTVPTLLGRPLDPDLGASLTAAALTLGSGSIAYAMVRFKFLDTALLARRGILYAVTSAILVGFYLTVIEGLNARVASAFGIGSEILEPVFLILALTLFQPVVARLEDGIDRAFQRDPSDPRTMLRTLTREIQTTIELEHLLARTARRVADALLPRSLHVLAITADGPVARAGAGEALSDDDLQGVADLLPRLPVEEPSVRLSEPIEGLRRTDRERLERLGVTLLVPVRWRGEVVGAVLLGDKHTRTGYRTEDVALLHTLAAALGVSLQNALLLRDRVRMARLEEELNLAQQIQQTFLRLDFPALPDCDVHGINLPSRQVGGDYLDVVPTPDGSFLLAIADVAGKGVPAALLSSMLQAALRTQALSVTSPADILRNVNALVYRSTALHQFATFFLARVAADGRTVTYANAGHNWPLLVRADGSHEWLKDGGTLLGILEDLPMPEGGVTLGPGDRLVLYTDGISEATNEDGELFGEERLLACVQALSVTSNPEAITASLLREVEAHLGRLEAQDDRTLLVLRVHDAARVVAQASPATEGVVVG